MEIKNILPSGDHTLAGGHKTVSEWCRKVGGTLCAPLLGMALLASCGSDITPASRIEGTYLTTRTTKLISTTQGGTLQTFEEEDLDVVVSASGDEMISIRVPATDITLGQEETRIPSFTLQYVMVMDDGFSGVCTAEQTAFDVNNKTYTGTLTLEVESNGYLELDLSYTYKDFPYRISQKFASPLPTD